MDIGVRCLDFFEDYLKVVRDLFCLYVHVSLLVHVFEFLVKDWEVQRVGVSWDKLLYIFFGQACVEISHKCLITISGNCLLLIFQRFSNFLDFFVPLHPFDELVDERYPSFFQVTKKSIMWCLCNILIFEVGDRICEHFEVKGFVVVGLVFNNVIIAINAFL